MRFLLEELLSGMFGTKPYAFDVDRNALVEDGFILGINSCAASCTYTGIVDHDIKTTILLDCRIYSSLDACWVSDVGLDESCARRVRRGRILRIDRVDDGSSVE